MAYEKVWANAEKLNATELAKLQKDGLEIINDIPKYAKEGFASIPKDQWDLFKWAGMYLQKPKEAGYFMMRVCVPSGILNYDQTVALGKIAKDYGRGVFDITTRQAIQFHWLTIEQIPDIYERLEAVGLSTIGACGDITRNITGNPIAGIDPDELFDTREVVKDVYDFFQMNEEFSNLPRKYKVSISANVNNSSNAEINCVAFTPASKVIDGEKVYGFHVKVGGGLSAKPFLAQPLDIFVRPEEVKKVAIGITTIFRDLGYREKRHHARLKFLVADWGVEKFKETLIKYIGEFESAGTDEMTGWNAGYFYGVNKQKQEGLNYVGFNVPVGRLTADEVLEIAEIAKEYGNGDIRTAGSQNLIIPNIPDANVEALLSKEIFERITINPNRFTAYSVACTGSEYCNLALTETKERMKRIAQYLDESIEVDVPVRIHMVGCPNSCGQRQIADIGLHGVRLKTKEKGLVEAFEIYVGGTLLNGGRYNDKLQGKIDGDDLPQVLIEFIQAFKEQKQPSETFFEYYNRVGLEQLQNNLNEIIEKTTSATI